MTDVETVIAARDIAVAAITTTAANVDLATQQADRAETAKSDAETARDDAQGAASVAAADAAAEVNAAVAGSATSAATSATNAAASETAASNSATTATTQATNASSSAAAAATSAADAATHQTALYLPGVAGNYISTPSSTAIAAVTGAFEIITKLALDDWTSASGNQVIASNTASTSRRHWELYLATGGQLQLQVNGNSGVGTHFATAGTTTNPSTLVSAGQWLWLKATVAVGAPTPWTATFYTSSDGTTWTQLGFSRSLTMVTATSFANTDPVTIGYGAATNTYLKGKIQRFTYKNGIGGTAVADWDGRLPADRFKGSLGNIWTVNGSAFAWQMGT